MPLFIERAAKPGGGVNVPEAAHRIGALFDAAMILRQSIVELGIAAVRHRFAQCLADGSWIRVMPVGGHLLWYLLRHLQSPLEEALSRLHSAVFAQQRVDQIARAVNRPYRYFHTPATLM